MAVEVVNTPVVMAVVVAVMVVVAEVVVAVATNVVRTITMPVNASIMSGYIFWQVHSLVKAMAEEVVDTPTVVALTFHSLADGEAVKYEIESNIDSRIKVVDVTGGVDSGYRSGYVGGNSYGGGRGGGGSGCFQCDEFGPFNRNCTESERDGGGGGRYFDGGGCGGGVKAMLINDIN
ncbi:hypothetical protein R3W88_005664 [Solanum pinnatisectum]|uniref:Glycine-rich protein n=1 Tax=Solanum pinnatisectum TaxID=50273 RepID=A0AAV9KCV5_9SOLN|nr:hypothetical protein R3W88_005664 [Solanum pinnatisectum]